MIAATANGRPRKKFQRQPALSVMTPPSSGPPTMPMPITAPMRPMYLPRSRGLMMSAIRTVPSAVRPPAPMPCRARMPMSIPVSVGQPGEGRGDDRDGERELDEQLAVDEVGQLAPDRRRDRRGEQGGGDHPGEGGLRAVEVGDDPRQRRGHDARREDRDEHPEQDAGEGLEDLAVGHLRGAAVAGLGGAGGFWCGGAGHGLALVVLAGWLRRRQVAGWGQAWAGTSPRAAGPVRRAG